MAEISVHTVCDESDIGVPLEFTFEVSVGHCFPIENKVSIFQSKNKGFNEVKGHFSPVPHCDEGCSYSITRRGLGLDCLTLCLACAEDHRHNLPNLHLENYTRDLEQL